MMGKNDLLELRELIFELDEIQGVLEYRSQMEQNRKPIMERLLFGVVGRLDALHLRLSQELDART